MLTTNWMMDTYFMYIDIKKFNGNVVCWLSVQYRPQNPNVKPSKRTNSYNATKQIIKQIEPTTN